MKEKFIAFLKKHRALRKFKANLLTRYGDIANIDVYCEEVNFSDIDGAFTWNDTPEGQDYWERLSKLWEYSK